MVGEALLFSPLIYIANTLYDPTIVPTAGVLTLFMFGGLTTVAFTTGKDFTFLGSAIKIGGCVALGLIVGGVVFGDTTVYVDPTQSLLNPENCEISYTSI